MDQPSSKSDGEAQFSWTLQHYLIDRLFASLHPVQPDPPVHHEADSSSSCVSQDTQCMTHDETLLGISEKIKNFAVICKSLTSPACAEAPRA